MVYILYIFLMAVDPDHGYSTELERSTQDSYDDFKLTKTLLSPWFIRKYFSALRAKVIKHTSQHHSTQNHNFKLHTVN